MGGQDELDRMLVEMSLSSIDNHTSSMAESINDVVKALEEQNEHLQTIAERPQNWKTLPMYSKGSTSDSPISSGISIDRRLIFLQATTKGSIKMNDADVGGEG